MQMSRPCKIDIQNRNLAFEINKFLYKTTLILALAQCIFINEFQFNPFV